MHTSMLGPGGGFPMDPAVLPFGASAHSSKHTACGLAAHAFMYAPSLGCRYKVGGLRTGAAAAHILIFDRRTKRVVEEAVNPALTLAMRAMYQSRASPAAASFFVPHVCLLMPARPLLYWLGVEAKVLARLQVLAGCTHRSGLYQLIAPMCRAGGQVPAAPRPRAEEAAPDDG